MKLYKCRKLNRPILLENGQAIESLEGLSIYAYVHWMEIYEGGFLFSPRMITLLGNQSKKDALSQLVEIVRISSLYSEEKIENLMEKIKVYDKGTREEQWKNKGDYYFIRGKLNRAIYCYQQSLEIKYQVTTENNLAIAYHKMHNIEKAIKHFRHAFSVSKDQEIMYNLLKLYRQRGMYDRGLELIFDNIENNKSYEIYRECGRIYKALKNQEQALTAFYKAYELEPSSDNLKEIIQTIVEHGEIEVGLKEVEGLKDLDYEEYVCMKANLLEKDKQYFEAFCLLEENEDKVQNKDKIYISMARLQKNMGSIIRAISYINKVEEKASDEVQYEMALIARSASNYTDYNSYIDHLLLKWKKDIRLNYKRMKDDEIFRKLKTSI